MIDYFVHDILDYTVLKGKKENFTKNIEIFDVKEAIDQVVNMLQDKAEMKQINIKTEFFGFEHQNNLIKTDEKRMQQVLLNLVSNALKFTKKNGQVLILVENISEVEISDISLVDDSQS